MSKSVRLTKAMREAFVRHVISEIPVKNFRDEAVKLIQDFAIARMPSAVRAVYENKDLRHWLNKEQVLVLRNCNRYNYIYTSSDGYRYDQYPLELQNQLKEFERLEDEQEKRILEIRRELEAITENCTTVKQFTDMFPEFKSYFPEHQERPKFLPSATSVITKMITAGWNKQQEVVAETQTPAVIALGAE